MTSTFSLGDITINRIVEQETPFWPALEFLPGESLADILRARVLAIACGVVAGKGLGGATVDMVIQAGGNAVILDVNEATGTAMTAKLGDRCRFVRTDVTIFFGGMLTSKSPLRAACSIPPRSRWRASACSRS